MKKIPRPVIILGLVSLFNDIASEMIYPVVPIFLTSVLGAPVTVVGLIEGIAEATASIVKFLAGYFSDRMRKRKIFVTLGYSFGTVSKALIGLAATWHFVLFARFIDRTGKGIRTAPRDALLLQNANPSNRGFIFGFHRAMDSMGAVVGPILALVLLSVLRENMRLVFLVAFIPAVIGVLLLIFLIHEKKIAEPQTKKAAKWISWREINPSLKLFLLISFIFALGNSSDAFLILRAKSLGLTTTLAVATYVLYNLAQTVFATPAGLLADKIGARRVFAGGLLVFSAVYFLFGIIHSPVWIWALFPIYGIYIAATDGVSKAYISEFITQRESGTYFGMYQFGIAICGFFASFVGGILWSRFSPSWTFYFGAFMAALAFLILLYGKSVKKI